MLWGILDAIYALIPLLAGYSILAGGQVGRIVGIVVAGLHAIRWLFYLPITPFTVVVIIVMDVLINYALVAGEEYSRSGTGPRASEGRH